MQFVPPTHEQTPIRCSGCHVHYVCFVPIRDPSTNIEEFTPAPCACGHLEERSMLPPGTLFSVKGESVKRYHPLTRPN